MTTIPVELANAREARTEAWNKYYVMLERDHTKEEFDNALAKVTEAEGIATEWYLRWQALGGTSDITSIVEVEALAAFADEQQEYSVADAVTAELSPKRLVELPAPKLNTLQALADAQEQSFNLRYYNNGGLPYFKHQDIDLDDGWDDAVIGGVER